jgi:hypothetical protein
MTNVKEYTTKELLDLVKALPSFKSIPCNYWILGVRSQTDALDQFDDKFYLFCGERSMRVLPGTTNAGKYGLLNFQKWNTKGCAVVKSDEWYYDMWTGGFHKGKIRALVQVGNCKYYRDNNRNTKCDETGTIYSGAIGINFHPASYNQDPTFIKTFVAKLIGAWSVGCQVPSRLVDFYEVMRYTYGQKRTSYCLLKEK